MHSRRLTIFPRTGDPVSSSPATHNETSATPTNTTKRKFRSGDRASNLELLKSSKLAKSLHRMYTPIGKNPEEFYRCIYIVDDPKRKRPYCLAQEKNLNVNEFPYRIVMIRRSAEQAVVGLSKPHPNLLNIINVFQYNASIFTVSDRPGLPLSEIAASHAPQLGPAEIKTICTEALSGICALNDAGLSLPKIEKEDITISAYDGRVKLAFDNAAYQGVTVNSKATPLRHMIEDVISDLPDRDLVESNEGLSAFIQSATCMTYAELLKVDYLKDALPARSLLPYVLTAQVAVMSLEHAIETQITDLREVEHVT